MAEGATANVLAGEANGIAFEKERAKGECLGECPIDVLAFFHGLTAAWDEAFFEGGMKVEIFGNRGENFPDVPKLCGIDTGGHRCVMVGNLFDGGGATECGAIAFFLELDHFLIAGFEFVPNGFLDGIGLVLGEGAIGNEFLFVEVVDWLACGNRLGDERCGECSLIGLVVALATVAIHVDDDIAAELLAEIEGKLSGPPEFLGALAVDVKNRSLDHFGNVGRIGRRTGV